MLEAVITTVYTLSAERQVLIRKARFLLTVSLWKSVSTHYLKYELPERWRDLSGTREIKPSHDTPFFLHLSAGLLASSEGGNGAKSCV